MEVDEPMSVSLPLSDVVLPTLEGASSLEPSRTAVADAELAAATTTTATTAAAAATTDAATSVASFASAASAASAAATAAAASAAVTATAAADAPKTADVALSAKGSEKKADEKEESKSVSCVDLFPIVAQERILGLIGALLPPNRQVTFLH